MKTIIELKAELDAANAKLQKLTRRDIRSGKGPSDEMKQHRVYARRVWEQWSNALDIEQGRAPRFPGV